MIDKRGSNLKTPLVVGYKGEIGSFILQGLLRMMPKATNILCYDINSNERESVSRIKKSDTIFLCVPLQNTEKWLRKYQPLLKDKVIFEQTSIKGNLLEKFKNLRLFSMHILFRPSATPVNIQRFVAIIDSRICHWTITRIEWMEQLLKSHIIIYPSAKAHDKEMAFMQSLTHRVILTLDKLMKREGAKTYLGLQIKQLADRIRRGDKELYRLIQKNKYLKMASEKFNITLKEFNPDTMMDLDL